MQNEGEASLPNIIMLQYFYLLVTIVPPTADAVPPPFCFAKKRDRYSQCFYLLVTIVPPTADAVTPPFCFAKKRDRNSQYFYYLLFAIYYLLFAICYTGDRHLKKNWKKVGFLLTKGKCSVKIPFAAY